MRGDSVIEAVKEAMSRDLSPENFVAILAELGFVIVIPSDALAHLIEMGLL